MNKGEKKTVIVPKIVNTLLPVLLAFLIGGVIIGAIGENPFKVYAIMLGKSLFTAKGFCNTLHYAAPLILTGLAIGITFKANIFNMGVEGQLLLGGFSCGIAGAFISIGNPFWHKVICMLVGMLFGALFALVPALLKAYFRVDEMVVTLTLNYAMIKILEYLASGPFREDGSGYVCTPTIRETAMFSRLGDFRLTLFFFIALGVLLVMAFVMKKTKLGFEVTAIGKNPEFSEALGMRVRKKIILLMCLSGALAGLAGSGQMMSETFKYTLTFSGTVGLGWEGMLIALLGRHNPPGILVAAIFYSGLKTGADNINMYTSVPKEIVGVLQALIILFLAVRFFHEKYGFMERLHMSKENRGAKQ